MSTPLVSVALPTRNRWPMLAKALDSVLQQEQVEVEVLVVDEASSDETPERLAEIDDDRLTVIRNQDPTGPGAARNEGARRAQGTWIAFLDDDDILAPHNFRTQLAGAEGHVLAYSGRLEVDDSLSVLHPSRAVRARNLERRLLSNNVIGGPSGVMVRAATFAETGGFDESFHPLADWDLWIRIARRGPASSTNEPLLAYRHHPENMMVTRAAEVDEEFVRLRAKHAAAAAAAGVDFGASWQLRRRAANALAEGHHVAAARDYAHAGLSSRSPRDLLRAAAVLGGGRSARLGRAAQQRAAQRPKWLDRYA